MTPKAKSLSVLIVDDESPARRLLKRLLQTDSDLTVIGECADGQDAVRAILELKPDLVFLDIQMPGMDGFEVLQELGNTRLPAIIFVTAYDQYAVKAFEAHALDYLLKPFTQKRFFDALARAKELTGQPKAPYRQHLRTLLRDWQHQPPADSSQAAKSAQVHRILVKSGNDIIKLKLDDIIWFESADHFVVAHTRNGKHLLSESLTTLEQSLPPAGFVRVHRSAIVNRTHVTRVLAGRFGSSSLVLSSGAKIRVSRSRRTALKDLLNH
ncbi:MAG: LytTR family DNA-binding domain-containing protein [Candidatus Zixiibacteriota bacterium]